MKKRICFIAYAIILLVVYSNYVNAQKSGEQDKLVYKADNLFKIGNYKAALPIYLQVLEGGDQHAVVHYNAGFCYFRMTEIDAQLKSIPYFQQAIKKNDGKVPVDVYYHLGKMYHKDNQIHKAIESLEAYKKKLKNIDPKVLKDVNSHLTMCQNALMLIGQPKKMEIQNFGKVINSEFTEYNPVVSADQSVMAYTALRPNSDRSRSAEEFVEEIYITYNTNGNWSSPQLVKVNSKFNIGTAGISADGQKMLIYIGGQNNTGDLFSIEKSGQEWTLPVTMGPMINSNFLESTASITPDGKRVYYASNKPGGYGGMDIYMSEKQANGAWGKSVNLGPTINTSSNEDAPFIHPDQKTLFFTSDGLNTMGGKDIFRTTLFRGKWSAPENMGYPINTPANDNYFTLTADGKKGFFSSDRKGGYGGQDIYFFDMPEEDVNVPLTMIKGKILAGEENNLQPVPTKIKVVDNETKEKVDYVYSPDKETGNYLIIFPPGKNYDMVIESEGYMPYTININIPNQTYFYELFQQIHLVPIKHFDVIVGQEVIVKNAFYDTKQKMVIDPKLANEAMLVQKDSLDLYDIMEAIVSSTDKEAFEYLLDLMYKINPVDSVNFNENEIEQIEAAKRIYYYDESDETTLEAKVIDGETIYSLPTMRVAELAIEQKNKKEVVISYNPKLLEVVEKVYFDPNKSVLKDTYHPKLDVILSEIKKHDNLGVEISGFASFEGDSEYNRKLSNQRAIEVLNYFNHKGIVRRRIVAKGYGATKLDKNKEEERRVEIRIVDLNQVVL